MTTTTTTTSASITPKVEISTGGNVHKNQKWENQTSPKIMQYGIIVLLTVITVAFGVVLVKSNSSKSASNTNSSSSSSSKKETTTIQASFTPNQMYDDTTIASKEQSDLWNT